MMLRLLTFAWFSCVGLSLGAQDSPVTDVNEVEAAAQELSVTLSPPVPCEVTMTSGSRLKTKLTVFSKDRILSASGPLKREKIRQIKFDSFTIHLDSDLFSDMVEKLRELPEAQPVVETTPPEPTTDPAPTDPAPMPDPTAGKYQLICGNCGKQIHITGESGSRCPHCRVVFSDADLREIVGTQKPNPQAEQPAKSNKNPFQTRPPQPATGGSPFASNDVTPLATQDPSAPQTLTLPPATAGPGVPGVGAAQEPMTMANMPAWMKAAAFVGMLVVGWVVVQMRS